MHPGNLSHRTARPGVAITVVLHSKIGSNYCRKQLIVYLTSYLLNDCVGFQPHPALNFGRSLWNGAGRACPLLCFQHGPILQGEGLQLPPQCFWTHVPSPSANRVSVHNCWRELNQPKANVMRKKKLLFFGLISWIVSPLSHKGTGAREKVRTGRGQREEGELDSL